MRKIHGIDDQDMALLPIFQLKARDRDGFRIASSVSAQDTSLDDMAFILLVATTGSHIVGAGKHTFM